MNTDNSRNRIVGIVDDDLDIVNLFRDALTAISEVTIHTFTDPILAMEHFQINEDAYILIISDLKMPGLSGIEFLRKVKQKNKFTRTILMTAFDIDDKLFRNYTKEKIIDAFLQKPIRINDLIKEVETQLCSHEAQQETPAQVSQQSKKF